MCFNKQKAFRLLTKCNPGKEQRLNYQPNELYNTANKARDVVGIDRNGSGKDLALLLNLDQGG